MIISCRGGANHDFYDNDLNIREPKKIFSNISMVHFFASTSFLRDTITVGIYIHIQIIEHDMTMMILMVEEC